MHALHFLLYLMTGALLVAGQENRTFPTANQEEGRGNESRHKALCKRVLQLDDSPEDCRCCLLSRDSNNALLWVDGCRVQTVDLNLVPVRLKEPITGGKLFMLLSQDVLTTIDPKMDKYKSDVNNEADNENWKDFMKDYQFYALATICHTKSLDANHSFNALSKVNTTPINITFCYNSANNTTSPCAVHVKPKKETFTPSLQKLASNIVEEQRKWTNCYAFLVYCIFRVTQSEPTNDRGSQENKCFGKISRIFLRLSLRSWDSVHILDEKSCSEKVSDALNSGKNTKLPEHFNMINENNCLLLMGSPECEQHFKIHISDNDTLDVSEYLRTSDTLEIINVVGHSLSLFSIACIAATAVAFKPWRQDLGNKILLHMSAAVLLNIPLFFIISYTAVDSDVTTCIIFGVLLHYACLSSFCWMLVMSGLQLLRLVTVLGAKRISHLLLKVAVFAWGLPLLPIIVLLALDTAFYSADMEEWGFCFPRGKALVLTVRVPLYIILTTNVVVFAVILCRIYMCCGWGKVDDELQRHGDRYRYTMNRTRTTVALFFLLGLPWTIGYLLYDPISSAYLFSITTSNQGVMLFVFFIVLDKKTRGYWREAFRKLKSRKRRKSSLSISKCKSIEAV